MNRVDIAVIGMGAAGLGALKTLNSAAVTTLGIEARNRAGGRAHTFMAGPTTDARWPVDLGAGWLHSANRNPLVAVLKSLGFTIDRTPAPWEKQSCDQGMTAEERSDFGKALKGAYDLMDQAAKLGDAAAGAFLPPGAKWNALIDAYSSYFSGAELAEISIRDLQAYQDTEIDYRVSEGYGTAIAALARNRLIVYGCMARLIDHTGADIRIATTQGDVVARKVIVTVPTPLIASGEIAFDPPLPDKQTVADHLPLGLSNKYMLHLAEAEQFPADGHLFGNPARTDTGSYHLRPFGRPLIEVYLGGRLARAMEGTGPQAAFHFFVEELVSLVGSHIRKQLSQIAHSAWGADPLARGSYSYAVPGHADDRKVLAAPVENRLFFAGEACSANWFSTAHGAYESGCSAAKAALANLEPRSLRYSAAAISLNNSG